MKTMILPALTFVMLLGACSERVVDGTVDTGLFVTETAVRTGVGAGKLVWKGGRWVARSATA